MLTTITYLQQKLFDNLEESMAEVTAERTRLAYDSGLQAAELSRLRNELQGLPALQAEQCQLRKNMSAVEARNVMVRNQLHT